MSRKNEQDARDIDTVFSRKQENEKELEVLKTELEAKKKLFDDMISSMDPEDTRRYQMLKENNAKITHVRNCTVLIYNTVYMSLFHVTVVVFCFLIYVHVGSAKRTRHP